MKIPIAPLLISLAAVLSASSLAPALGDPAGAEHLEAAHAMARIRGGYLESDVIPLDTTVSTMAWLDEARHQLGVVYPVEH